jgi:beta-glucosidase
MVGSLVVAMSLVACSKEEPAAPPESAANDAAQVNPETWPQPQRPAIDDSGIEARLDELVGSLSVEEKVGQIIQADLCCVTPDDVRQYRLGSILVGGNSGPNGDDLAPAPKWLEAADAFYAASMDTSAGGHAIPILWGVEAVHGHNNIIGATLFPHNVALGATRDRS